MNSVALSVAVKLLSTQAIGASLGEQVAYKNAYAGLIGTLIVALFLVLSYRLPGLLAVIALTIYVILNLALVKLIPITLTAAGIAGFVMSIEWQLMQTFLSSSNQRGASSSLSISKHAPKDFPGHGFQFVIRTSLR